MSLLATTSTGLAALVPMATEAGATSTGEAVLFWVLAPIMVLGALGLLFARKAVHAAMSLVLVMISLAFLYVAQDAPFLGVVQVVVYTGAIMMLFLFVLMLVGVDASDSLAETIRGQRWIGLLAGLGLVVVLIGVVARAVLPTPVGLQAANADTNPVGIARIVFADHVFALEVVGALLVTAALGALVLTHKQRLTPRVGQRERADARVQAGGSLTPLPAPGVYARHNAMDVPALDPEGRPIEASVSRVLRVRGQQYGRRDLSPHLDPAEGGALIGLPQEVAESPADQASDVMPQGLPPTRVDPGSPGDPSEPTEPTTRTEEGL